MKKAKRCLITVVSGVLVATAVLSGCGQSKKEVSKNDDHLTVYLWLLPFAPADRTERRILCCS